MVLPPPDTIMAHPSTQRVLDLAQSVDSLSLGDFSAFPTPPPSDTPSSSSTSTSTSMPPPTAASSAQASTTDRVALYPSHVAPSTDPKPPLSLLHKPPLPPGTCSIRGKGPAGSLHPQSSGSGSSSGIGSGGGVHELLECPVCLNTMFPPIHQCPNGHTLCSLCKPQVGNRCPACRSELGNIRCLALEKVAESLELPCKHQQLGCPQVLAYYSKLTHEAQCPCRPYSCPYAGSECSVTGDVLSLVAHLRDEHLVDMHSGSTFNHRYVKQNPQEVENATWMLTVFNCFGQHFCLHFEAFQLGGAPVYMAFLRFMGEDSDAKRFSYSLEVGGNGRKVIWQGVPRSIRDSHRKVRDSHDGLIIQRSMGLFFSGGDHKELKLRVTGRIWKEDAGR